MRRRIRSPESFGEGLVFLVIMGGFLWGLAHGFWVPGGLILVAAVLALVLWDDALVDREAAKRVADSERKGGVRER